MKIPNNGKNNVFTIFPRGCRIPYSNSPFKIASKPREINIPKIPEYVLYLNLFKKGKSYLKKTTKPIPVKNSIHLPKKV